MIEENTPEISIDELIQKIKKEVAKHNKYQSQTTLKSKIPNTISTLNPILADIKACLKNAELRSEVRTKWPDNLNKFPFNLSKTFQKIPLKILNFLFKDQREVNFNLIRALKGAISINQELIEQIKNLRLQMDGRLTDMDERWSNVCNRFPNIDEKLNKIDTQVNSWIASTRESLDDVKSQAQLTEERLSTLETHIQEENERLNVLDTRFQVMEQSYLRNDNYLKNDLIQQKRLISMFFEEVRGRLPQPLNREQLQIFTHEEQHLLDAFYVAFEDEFRGSREDILNRLKVYLPLIAEAKADTSNYPILDLGCGRGEWLDLLQQSGYRAKGIDINRVMLDLCKARGLEVVESDAIAYLRSLPDNSLSAVTGFHVIEHLRFPVLMQLFDEIIRVLTPGGLVIFETPNPRHILVGSGDFYRDPTHQHPIHPDTIRFIAESKGFIRSESYFFQDKDGYAYMNKSSQTKFDTLNDYINVSRDYAMIAYKP